MKKTILVTGGAGFIGANLCEKLLLAGHEVICLDNLLTGSQKNVARLFSDKKFFFIQQDVCDEFKTKKFQISEIYHLASPADPNLNSKFSYMTLPFETMRANTIGTWKMCELALKNKAKFSFASTSEVYGDPLVSPQNETYRGNVSTTGPRSVYDESKRFGETIVSAFVREKSLDGRITRIFNTYGPGMNVNEGRAVVNFINQSLLGKPITIYGYGAQTRSFCYIDDQIDGQILAMEKGGAGEVFNIGNPDEITILEFANIIKKITKSSSEIIYSQELPADDPLQRKPDIVKAMKTLGWQPNVKLAQGLSKTINYFRENIHIG